MNQEHIFLVAKSAGYASFIYARLRDRLTCHLLWSAAALASNSRAPPEPFPPTKGVQGSRYPKHPAAFRSPLWQLGWSLRWPRTSSRLLSPPSKCAKHALRAAHLCAPWPPGKRACTKTKVALWQRSETLTGRCQYQGMAN